MWLISWTSPPKLQFGHSWARPCQVRGYIQMQLQFWTNYRKVGDKICLWGFVFFFFLLFILEYYCFWRRQWHPTPILLPGKSHGQRSLVGCSPWGRQELDMTEWLHFHFSLSCIGEGNGNPLQCSCLENPRDGGAWWAAFYAVAQSRTQLKQLSSTTSSISSSNKCKNWFFERNNKVPNC